MTTFLCVQVIRNDVNGYFLFVNIRFAVNNYYNITFIYIYIYLLRNINPDSRVLKSKTGSVEFL